MTKPKPNSARYPVLNKSDIAATEIKANPTASSLALARLLLKKYPALWHSINHARHAVRSHRQKIKAQSRTLDDGLPGTPQTVDCTHVNNLVVVSDLHCGCRFGLCPPRIAVDGGSIYEQSPLQAKVWERWQFFWSEWVPSVCHDEPFAVAVNGDSLDGRHHGSTTQISQNLADQQKIAMEVLKPVRDLCDGRLYMIRGTEAHVGQSGENEENLARELGAIPDGGHYSRFELWVRVGGKCLCHLTHHIGTTGSSHYESSAVMKELSESYAEAGRWRREPPDVVVRSHRHRHLEVRVPTSNTYGISFVTAGWQLKTPFVYKIPGGRVTTPQLGGSLIRQGDCDLYTRHKIWDIERPQEVML